MVHEHKEKEDEEEARQALVEEIEDDEDKNTGNYHYAQKILNFPHFFASPLVKCKWVKFNFSE